MSHNSLKIGTATQNVNGELSPALNDLSDVSGAPVAGQVLSFSGSAWSPATPSSNIARVCFSSWRSQGGFGTGTTYLVPNYNNIWRNAQFRLDDSTYATRVNASGSLVVATTNAWMQYWTLKASALAGKTIRCEAVHMGSSLTGTESITYQWGVGSSNLATYTPIGNVAEQNNNYTQTAFGHYVMGSSDINLALKVVDVGTNQVSYMSTATTYLSYLTLSILAE